MRNQKRSYSQVVMGGVECISRDLAFCNLDFRTTRLRTQDNIEDTPCFTIKIATLITRKLRWVREGRELFGFISFRQYENWGLTGFTGGIFKTELGTSAFRNSPQLLIWHSYFFLFFGIAAALRDRLRIHLYLVILYPSKIVGALVSMNRFAASDPEPETGNQRPSQSHLITSDVVAPKDCVITKPAP